ncbi:MAG: YlmC/YmxH family sporulation protein [Bacillota bacterium]|nr:YlmC/YmxH family sporulation protein [Bacillota bacterium]
MRLRTSDMRERDVIDVLTGRRLGNIEDLDIDVEAGRVRALILPGERRLLGLFGGGKEIRIPWTAVQVIGEDVILVRSEQLAAGEGRKEGPWAGAEEETRPGGEPHGRGGFPHS